MIRRLTLLTNLKLPNGILFASTTAKKSKQIPIITCKNAKFNLYQDGNNINEEVKDENLASKGWQHHKAKGDFFTIHPQQDVIESRFKDAINIDELNINAKLKSNASIKHNISKITKLQKEAIENISEGKHVLIAAETGCGKVNSFIQFHRISHYFHHAF